MATNHWIGVSGDWSTASDWSADAVPGPSDKAAIDSAGSYTVTVSTLDTVGSVVLNDPGAILEVQGTLSVDKSLTVRSGTLFLDGGTIENGSLTIDHGGTLITDATSIYVGSSVLLNVSVLGGLTLNAGSLLFSGTTTVENSNGTGPGEITLNGSSRLFLGEKYTFDKLILNGGVVAGGGGSATIGKGGLVQGYGEFFEGQETPLVVGNEGTIKANVDGETLYIGEADGGLSFTNDGHVLATDGGIISINFNDPDIDPWSNNADGKISAINGTLQLGGFATNYGLIRGVNSTVYFGDDVISFSQNPGDIVVLGGELLLGNQRSAFNLRWTDSGLIKAVGAATEVLGGGTVSAGGTMSIQGGSLSGSAILEDDGLIKLSSASVDLSSLTVGLGGELSGSGTVADPLANSGIINASVGKLDLGGAVTGIGQLQIGNGATLELGGTTAEAATFEGKLGTLLLDDPSRFSGTVAGMAKGDGIDLADFAFSSHPTISNVVGTGAAGTTTDVTVRDGLQTTTIDLLNQYANQFAVSPGAYTLASDHLGSSAGTFLTLASPKMS